MVKRTPNNKYKKVIRTFPENVPRRLISEYDRVVKQYNEKGGFQRKLARRLDVNDLYIHNLLINGIEPTDQTANGRALRVKLFLPKRKRKPRQPKPEEWLGQKEVSKAVRSMVEKTRKALKVTR